MKRAIDVLKNEVTKCDYMDKFLEDELYKYVGVLADQTVLESLKAKKAELCEVKNECLDAIEYLKLAR
jgi:hypothetical protein